MRYRRLSYFVDRILLSPTLRRRAALLLWLAVFGLLSAGTLLYYRSRVADNLVWSDARIERESRLVYRIFEMSKKNDLVALRKDRKTGRLTIVPPPCEQSILKATAVSKEKSAALVLLCNSPQGEEVRNEINAWNSSYDFLAIRDNRSQNDDCRRSNNSSDEKVDVYVPYGCKPNEWQIERIVDGASGVATLVSGAEPPPSQFGFIIDPDDPVTYDGDWALVSPDPYSGVGSAPARYRLRTRLSLPANGIVSIDLIGRLRAVKIDGNPLTFDPAKPQVDPWVKIGGANVRVWLTCNQDDLEDNDGEKDAEDDEGDNPDLDCSAEPGQRVRFAYQIDLAPLARVAAGQRGRAPPEVEIVLEAESTTLLPRILRDAEDGKFSLQLTRHLRATCMGGWLDAANPVARCNLDWRYIDAVDAPGKSRLRIVLGDGTRPNEDLIDPKTNFILPRAFERGFAPIVGFGPQEWGSLIATLATRPPESSPPRPAAQNKAEILTRIFPLTIDERIQEAAFETLKEHQNCQSKKSKKPAQRPTCSNRQARQTATLVVLDAEKRPGDILALASLPTPPRKLHMWDLAALAEGSSPMSGLGWREATRDNVPGSTFKAVTSLAAISAAAAPDMQPDFAATLKLLLSSGMDARGEVSQLGLAYAPAPAVVSVGPRRHTPPCVVEQRRPEDANAIPVPNLANPFWCGRNFGFRKTGGVFWAPRNPAETGCPAALVRGPQFGMCEALMVSSNLFFGGLARLLMQSPLIDNRVDPLTLRIARRLTLGSNVEPVAGRIEKPPGIEFDFDLTRGLAPSSKLKADPVKMAAADPEFRVAHPDSVVRSGFGDQVEATPLAITTIYASIGLNKVVRPTIVPLERRQGCPVVTADADECTGLLPGTRGADALIASLRAGLHAVARAGSARGAFNTPDGRTLMEAGGLPRLFAKTGTATVVPGRRFSLWTAGWIDGVPYTNIPSRLAFACFLTHRGNSDTGGADCAPIVRDFLVKLNRTSLAQ